MADHGEGFSRFMNRIGGRPLLTAAEEKALAARAADGDTSARDQLVERNIGLVVSMAKRYASMGFELEDLVQEGLVGLTKAVDRFDHRKGHKLSTYATWWIKQALFRYMNGPAGPAIRVPGKVIHTRRVVRRRAQELGLSEEDAAFEMGVTPEHFHEAFSGPRVTVSLDQSLGEDGGDRHEGIPDPEGGDPSEVSEASGPGLAAALARLDPLRRRVVELRMGFDGEPRTRNEVARELKIGTKVAQKELVAGVRELRRYLVLERAEEEGEDPTRAVLKDLAESSPKDPVKCEQKGSDGAP